MTKVLKFTIYSFILLVSCQLDAQCVSGDCKNGKGIYLFPSGAKYIGNFKKGECDGIGVCYYTDGSKYQGMWVARYPEGHGIKTYPDGTVRNGYWKKGKPVDENGQVVEEIIVKKESKNDGTDIQSGCLTGNCKNGEGVLAYVDGSKYEGQFINGKINGTGTWYYPNNDKYVGNFKDNQFEGKGILYKTDGTQLKGVWQAGEYKGEPVVVAAKTGCISGNCQTGQGTYVYKDNTAKYIGSFVNGKSEGKGTIEYSNGDSYTGDWKDGKYYGNGVLTQQNGIKVEGQWHAGEFQAIPVDNVAVNHDANTVPQTPKNAIPVRRMKIWALIVGVAQYSHMPVLRYPDDDAYRMYAFLKSPEGGGLPDQQVKVLIDEDATKQKIKVNMKELFSQAGPDDVVLFYFAGHGLKGSFLPVDFDGFNFKLSHEEINAIMEESNARFRLTVADACHSGSAVADFGGDKDLMMNSLYTNFNSKNQEQAILMSSKSEETSLESQGLRQGVFSHFLIRGLKGEADKNKDNIVTIKELYDFIYDNVKEYTGDKQTPVIKGNYEENMPVAVLKGS